MKLTLQNAGVLVTGASRGLGRALAEALASRGARVVLVARDASSLGPVVDAIRARGGIAHAVVADISDKDSVYAIAAAAEAAAGPLDVLVHNASALGPVPLRPLLDTDCEDLERVLAANLVGPFRISKAVVGPMVLRGRGLVVHVSSDAAVEGYPAWGPYGASKAAHDQLARVWGGELAAHGVRYVSVDPGEMDTQMHADAIPDADPSTLARPRDVAERFVSLIERAHELTPGARLSASELSRFVTSPAPAEAA